MSNTILIKRGIGKPDSLVEGELAVDTGTGALYSLVGGVVTEINEPPEGVDLSDYIDRTTRNDVVEGSFSIHWDDSADQTYPFNGRIGYNRTAEDPNSLEGSFLYASGTRGTFSIGRDGDVELHGPSEIQGIPDRNDDRPWITGFSYVQAADFLDEDGNSIVPDVSNLMSTDSLNQCWDETWGIIGEGFEFRTDSLRTNRFFNHIFQDWYSISSSTDPDTYVFRLTAFGGGAAYFNGTVQATDFLDADGNSIIGSGGGGNDLNISYDGESGWAFHKDGGGNPVITFSSTGSAVFDRTVTANHQITAKSWITSLEGDIVASEGNVKAAKGYVQATDFLDADGNSIIGSGGGEDHSHTDDKNNIFIGENALAQNEGGFDNVGIGKSALINSITGIYNTAIGSKAMRGNTGGNSNTAVGYDANSGLDSGNYNTAIGSSALSSASVGSTKLTGIGSFSGVKNPFGPAIENSTAIGYYAEVDASNKIQLGNTDVELVHTHGVMQAADFLDADGNSIIGGGGGGGDPDWALVSDVKESVAIGFNAGSGDRGVGIGHSAIGGNYAVSVGRVTYSTTNATAIGDNAMAMHMASIALGKGAMTKKNAEFVISPTIEEVNFSGTTVQADDFLDKDGNSIVQPPVDLTGYATEAYVGQQIAAIPPPAVPDNVTSATRLKSYEHGLVLGSSPGFGGNNLFVLGSDVNGAYNSRVMMGNGLSQQFSIMYAENFYKAGSPMLAAVDLIDTFTTIKSAISEEQTVEGLRTAVLSGLDAVIDKLQAMEDKAEEDGHKR